MWLKTTKILPGWRQNTSITQRIESVSTCQQKSFKWIQITNNGLNDTKLLKWIIMTKINQIRGCLHMMSVTKGGWGSQLISDFF